MEQTKYEIKLREQAEEFAKEWENENIKTPDADYFEELVDNYIPAARISLQREAEAYRKAVDRYVPGGVKEKIAMQQLQSLGLVP